MPLAGEREESAVSMNARGGHECSECSQRVLNDSSVLAKCTNRKQTRIVRSPPNPSLQLHKHAPCTTFPSKRAHTKRCNTRASPRAKRRPTLLPPLTPKHPHVCTNTPTVHRLPLEDSKQHRTNKRIPFAPTTPQHGCTNTLIRTITTKNIPTHDLHKPCTRQGGRHRRPSRP